MIELMNLDAESSDSFEFAGLSAHLDIGMKLTSSLNSVASVAKTLTALFDNAPQVPVQLVGVSQDSQTVSLTFAITLGSLEEIRSSSPRALCAMNLMSDIVAVLSSCEPVLTALPVQGSAESIAACKFLASKRTTVHGAGRILDLVG